MTPGSAWAVSPDYQAAVKALEEATKTQAKRELTPLYEALGMFQAQLRAYCEAGLRAEQERVKVRIARTEAQIAERRAVLEAKP